MVRQLLLLLLLLQQQLLLVLHLVEVVLLLRLVVVGMGMRGRWWGVPRVHWGMLVETCLVKRRALHIHVGLLRLMMLWHLQIHELCDLGCRQKGVGKANGTSVMLHFQGVVHVKLSMALQDSVIYEHALD